MGANSKIEWTDHTFNPWIGCERVSPACDNCYAEAWARRFRPHDGLWAGNRARTAQAQWDRVWAWDRAAAASGTRPRVFAPSMGDSLDPAVPAEWRADFLALIRDTPHLIWLLLTKRPGHLWSSDPGMREFSRAVCRLHHVWLGTTVEASEHLDRIETLMSKSRTGNIFVSVEPMLGAVRMMGRDYHTAVGAKGWPAWVIAGGESGPHARPTNPDHFRHLRNDCQALEIPFFFKQWGRHVPPGQEAPPGSPPFLDGVAWQQLPAAMTRRNI